VDRDSGAVDPKRAAVKRSLLPGKKISVADSLRAKVFNLVPRAPNNDDLDDEFFKDFPQLVLGCWQLRDVSRNVALAKAGLDGRDIVRAHLDAGIRAFDTVDAYGTSEKLLGEALLTWKRDTDYSESKDLKEVGNGKIAIFSVLHSRHLEKAARVVEFTKESLYGGSFGRKDSKSGGGDTSTETNIRGELAREKTRPLELLQYFVCGDAGDYCTTKASAAARKATNVLDSGDSTSSPNDVTSRDLVTPPDHFNHFLEASRILMHLKKTERIRHIGLRDFDTDACREMLMIGCPIRTNQVQFSILDRRPEISELVHVARSFRFKLLCYGCVAGGWLSDRWLGIDADPMPPLRQRNCPKLVATDLKLKKYKQNIDLWGSWNDFQRLLNVMDFVRRRVGERVRARSIFAGKSNRNGAEKTTEGTTGRDEANRSEAGVEGDGDHDHSAGAACGVSLSQVAVLWVWWKLEHVAYGGGVILGARNCNHVGETKQLLAWALLNRRVLAEEREATARAEREAAGVGEDDVGRTEVVAGAHRRLSTESDARQEVLIARGVWLTREEVGWIDHAYHEKVDICPRGGRISNSSPRPKSAEEQARIAAQKVMDRERINIYGLERDMLERTAKAKDKLRLENRAELRAEYEAALQKAEELGRAEEERKKKDALARNEARKAEIQMHAMKKIMSSGKNPFRGMKF